jgi:hypothetical protein
MPTNNPTSEIKYATSQDEANLYIKAGWEYLTTVMNDRKTITAPGWFKTQAPIHPRIEGILDTV